MSTRPTGLSEREVHPGARAAAAPQGGARVPGRADPPCPCVQTQTQTRRADGLPLGVVAQPAGAAMVPARIPQHWVILTPWDAHSLVRVRLVDHAVPRPRRPVRPNGMGAPHFKSGSRTGSQFPRSSATTFRELPCGVKVVGHPDLTLVPTLTSLWCSVTTNSSVGTSMLDAAFRRGRSYTAQHAHRGREFARRDVYGARIQDPDEWRT